MRAYLAVTTVAIAMAACGRNTDPVDQGSTFVHVEAGDTIRLAYGESATLGSGGARITFRAVEGDSRCPINAVCVWAGDAHIRLAGIDAAAGTMIDLHLHTRLEPRSAEFADFRIELLEVAPAPVDPPAARAEDYSVRLAISRG